MGREKWEEEMGKGEKEREKELRRGGKWKGKKCRGKK
jgi:hypothetical protein